MPGLYTDQAMDAAATATTETDPDTLVKIAKALASEVRGLRVAIHEHRGIIVALSDTGHDIVERLDTRWPL